MELWIPLTIAAAGIQAARTALQKNLSQTITVLGATFARFLFGLPVIIAGLAGILFVNGQSLQAPNGPFIGYALSGGVAQLIGNALLLQLLNLSTFTVGTTYTKTEVIQTVGVSYVVIDERVEAVGLAGIIVAFVGVVLMATGRAGLSMASMFKALRHKPALYGLIVGALYALAAVFFRAAALALPEGDFVFRAVNTLAWVIVVQMILMLLWLRWKKPGVITAVAKAWPMGCWVGLTGVVSSACWYTAFTLQKVSYVMALGQIELVMTYIISRLVFKERMTQSEAIGVALTMAGILAVVMYR